MYKNKKNILQILIIMIYCLGNYYKIDVEFEFLKVVLSCAKTTQF